eukprot:sb/3478556/
MIAACQTELFETRDDIEVKNIMGIMRFCLGVILAFAVRCANLERLVAWFVEFGRNALENKEYIGLPMQLMSCFSPSLTQAISSSPSPVFKNFDNYTRGVE